MRVTALFLSSDQPAARQVPLTTEMLPSASPDIFRGRTRADPRESIVRMMFGMTGQVRLSTRSTRSHRKDLGNFDGYFNSGLASHFRAGGSSYSREEYDPLSAFLPGRLLKWLPHVAKFWFRKKHPFQHFPSPDDRNGIVQIEDHATFGILGDWGTGTDESQLVADGVRESRPDFTIHLGDVYYVGDEDEIKENFLGERTSSYEPVQWPMGTKGSFALSGNHEMYARGNGYFRSILPRMGLRSPESEWGTGQPANFFCLGNRFWRIIGLDTAYNSTAFDFGKMPILQRNKWLRKSGHLKPKCTIPEELLAWLENVVQPNKDGRGLILLSHHGSHSAFSDWYQIPAKQLARVIRRPVIWFWGHEHKLAIYDKFAPPEGIESYGRCVGHAGMPVERGKPPDLDCPWLAWDNRRYDNGEKIDAGYNGYVNVKLDGPLMGAEYINLHGNAILAEDWQVDLNSGELKGPHLRRLLNDPAIHIRQR